MIHYYRIVRLGAEIIFSALVGMAIVVLPVLIDGRHSQNSAVFFPLIGNAVEDITFFTLGILFLLGLLLGIFGQGTVLLIGSATMLVFPMWSLTDMLAGCTGHDLWPMEWLFFGIESFPGLVGAIIGRVLKRC